MSGDFFITTLYGFIHTVEYGVGNMGIIPVLEVRYPFNW